MSSHMRRSLRFAIGRTPNIELEPPSGCRLYACARVCIVCAGARARAVVFVVVGRAGGRAGCRGVCAIERWRQAHTRSRALRPARCVRVSPRARPLAKLRSRPQGGGALAPDLLRRFNAVLVGVSCGITALHTPYYALLYFFDAQRKSTTHGFFNIQ